MRIGLVIDQQPTDTYAAILEVLQSIRSLGRSVSTLDLAVDYLREKIQTKAGANIQGQTFVLTGNLSAMSRDECAILVESRGGRVSSSVSKKTAYLVIGDSAVDKKIARATELDIPILDENGFLELLGQK